MPTVKGFTNFLKSKLTLNRLSFLLVVLAAGITGAIINNYATTYRIKKELVNQGYSLEELAASLKSIKGSIGNKGNDPATAKELTDLIRSIAGKGNNNAQALSSNDNDIYYASGHASPTLPDSKGILKTIDSTSETMNVYETPEDSGDVVSTLLSGELAFYYQKTDGWYQIEYKPYKLGWVKAQYLEPRE